MTKRKKADVVREYLFLTTVQEGRNTIGSLETENSAFIGLAAGRTEVEALSNLVKRWPWLKDEITAVIAHPVQGRARYLLVNGGTNNASETR